MFSSKFSLLLGVAVFLSVSAYIYFKKESEAEGPIPSTISYNYHIRPILSDKCFACHGPDEAKREAGLRLDIAEEAYKALAENPSFHGIVPKDSRNSAVYQRIIASDPQLVMPPVESNLSLTEVEIQLIKKWIDNGAVYEKHWAFIVPKKAELPAVKNRDWAKNEIDYFILQKAESKGLKVSESADKSRLLKRVSLDLIGLLPTTEAIEKFHDQVSYGEVVDELLESASYGEKWAIHWLDIARYADSYGYQEDNFRTQWPWRDWVIHALNQNMPFKDFITWQLAGDLLPESNKEQLLATGFNRNHKITEEGAIDEEEYRVTYVADRTDTFGKAFLGLTLECARCHDHKYDPISQKEYYELFAFFNNVDEKNKEYVVIDPLVGKPESWAKKPMMEITDEDAKGILSFIQKATPDRLIVSVMGDLDTLRPTYLLKRGEFNSYGEVVKTNSPQALSPFLNQYPKNRLGLAQWLIAKENPLAARVVVNRIWQELFGVGIVPTSSDFGMQGELPTHPELLDWLAVDFMEHNWDLKYLIKKIVSSATYQQSSIRPEKNVLKDPTNEYLTWYPRRRMKAEVIRDIVLQSSGLLVPQIGGPSVKPYQPPGLWESATAGGGNALSKYVQDHGDSLYRKGLYTFVKRTVPPPSMILFDASNRDQCEVQRTTTSTPLQALVMMNDPTVLEAARVFAERLQVKQKGENVRILAAFKAIVCRHPTESEQQLLLELYKDQLASIDLNKALKLLNVGEYRQEKKADPIQTAALMQIIMAIYNLEETVTKS